MGLQAFGWMCLAVSAGAAALLVVGLVHDWLR